MTDTMQAVYSVYSGRDLTTGANNGNGSVWINPDQQSASPDYDTYNLGSPNYWALVLDRTDPTKSALYNAALPNNTDMPANLASLMTPDHLLFFYATAYMYYMPQGDLYTTLAANGGGGMLERTERFAYYNGCGMVGNSLYVLVSIPGSGTTGIEKFGVQRGTYTYNSNPSVNTWGYDFSNYSMLLNLVPSASGYVPVEVGGTDA